MVHTNKNACVGIDFNAGRRSLTYVKLDSDGNIAKDREILFKWKGLTTGKRQKHMINIVSQAVEIVDVFECAIAIESLDFSKKK